MINNKYIHILAPLILNVVAFFIIPTKFFFLLSFVTVVYFYIQFNKIEIELFSIEYILSILFLLGIVFIDNQIKYVLIPIEGLIIVRILVSNKDILSHKENKEVRHIDIKKENSKKLSSNDIENNINYLLEKHLLDLKIELSSDINNKLERIQSQILDVNGSNKQSKDEITGLVNKQIQEGLEEIRKNVKEDIDKHDVIDEKYIINMINEEINQSDLLKDSFTNDILEKIKTGKVDPFNTRQIKNKEIKKIFIDTFSKAENEINIISPWISNWIFEDEGLMNGFDNALRRGVKIKILYGIGGNNSNKYKRDKRSEMTEENAKKLKYIFRQFGDNLILKRINTHEKLLLCDEKYVLIGSYNFLSFNGDYAGDDIRSECVQYQEHKAYINKLRKEYFDF